MHPLSISVTFRNLLPDEELLNFARRLWAGLSFGDNLTSASLFIAREQHGKSQRFRVELEVPADNARGQADDVDPFLAVKSAFERLGAYSELRHACA